MQSSDQRKENGDPKKNVRLPENKTDSEGGQTMKDVIIEMFLALAAVNVATKQFSCYPY